MKQWLKQVLPAFCWRGLRKAKRGCLKSISQLTSMALGLWPMRLRIYLKRHLNIVGKLDYDKADIWMNVSSVIEYYRLNSCVKERETIEWIERYIKENDVVFDVGANVGAYSLIMASRLNNQGMVYAFEPSFLNFKTLCENVYLNQSQQKIRPFSLALSDKTEMACFNYQNLVPGGALHTLGEALDYKKDRFSPVFRQYLMSYRIDDLIQRYGIPVPQHIKIDVDGIEEQVLKGAACALADARLKSLMIELGAHDKERIIAYLSSKGLYLVASYHNNPDNAYGYNCLFSR